MARSKSAGKMVPVYLKSVVYQLWLKLPKGTRSALVSECIKARFGVTEVDEDAGS